MSEGIASWLWILFGLCGMMWWIVRNRMFDAPCCFAMWLFGGFFLGPLTILLFIFEPGTRIDGSEGDGR